MNAVNKVLNKRNKLLLLQPTSECTTTIYDLLVRIIQPLIGNERERLIANELLSFLNKKVGELLELFGDNNLLINQLKSQMADLFRDNEARYLEKIGELLSTIHLIKSHPEYQILAIGYKHETVNGKREKDSKDTDILFEHSVNKQKILVDILNISLDFQKIENEDGLNVIIRDRIGRKREQKLYDDEIILSYFSETIIQPFIWIYNADTIFRYKNAFKNITDKNTYPILLLRQQSDNKGNLYYDYCEADKFFN